MKYKLSFCEIEQLSANIFEVTINDGATIDEKCAEEAEIFWKNLRKEPYGLLVNNKNRFSYSFMGAQRIGEHPLERKTAILINSPLSENQISTVMDLKQIGGTVHSKSVFRDREEAIKWLETPLPDPDSPTRT